MPNPLATLGSHGGAALRNRRILLLGISLSLAIYALVVSRFLPSGLFLIVFFGWLWIGVSVLFDRLEAAKAMSLTMTAVLVISSLTVMMTPLGKGDMTAFFSLAIFPSLITWICAYVYILHMQRANDVGARVMGTWFEEKERAKHLRTQASSTDGQTFIDKMTGDPQQDNDGSTSSTEASVARQSPDRPKLASGS
jgi:hypothetical protein